MQVSLELELGACSVVSCFSGFTTGIAGELRAGTGCMQCGELHSGFRPDVANFIKIKTAEYCGSLTGIFGRQVT